MADTLPLFFKIIMGLNIFVFFVYWLDKANSISKKRRISERTLWILALLGGSPGALLSMHLFRHKTKKLSFQAGLAVILLVQVWFVYFILVR